MTTAPTLLPALPLTAAPTAVSTIGQGRRAIVGPTPRMLAECDPSDTSERGVGSR